MSFEECWAFTCPIEAGYWNDPVGGPTKYGVTERVARDWGYQGDMQQFPLESAKAIAKKKYYDQFQCDQFPAPLAILVFDTAYNGGKPIKWLQAAVGTTDDGIIGAKTIAAARAADIPKTVALFCAARMRYMQSLHNFHENAGGWFLRIASLLERGVK